VTSSRSCAYCGWKVAKIRRPGEKPTCVSCRDLPRAERDAELEVDELLERRYNGDEPVDATNPLPTLDT
jgi:hypothetical protein